MKEKLILVEKYIEGSDYTVALMNGKVLGILEIIPNKSFYNFSAKYNSKETIYRYPKKTSPEIINRIIKYAKLANKVLKCTGITRVDFRVNLKGEEDIYVLEINTQPGLTKSSLVPKIAKQSGVSFDNLIDWIVKDAKLIKSKLIEIFKVYKLKLSICFLFVTLVLIFGMQRNIIFIYFDNYIKNLGFSLKKINITGISKLDEHEIKKHIKYKNCENLFCVDLGATKNSLEKLDWIKSANLKLILPSELKY